MSVKVEKKTKIFCLVATSIFMSTLDSSIVNVALPYIMESFQTRVDVIQWVVISYLLTVSSLLLIFGRLSDIRGRRLVYCSGFLVFTLGSLLCSLSNTPYFLVGSRVVQGCGAAMLMACSPALIVDAFPPNERGKALGMVGAVVAAGLTAGPFIGGMLLDHFSWRAIFYINLPIGIAATIGGFILLRGGSMDQGSGEPLDFLGGVMLAISLIALISGMTQLERWSVASFEFMVTTLVFFMAAAGFFIVEFKTDYPLLDPVLLRIRLFVFPVINSALLFCTLFIVIFIMPFYLVQVCGYSASATGIVMTTPFIFLLVVSPVSGALYDRTGSLVLCLLGLFVVMTALITLLFLSPGMPQSSVIWRLSLIGLGTALFVSPNNTEVMSAVPVHRRGIASGAVATARNLGMVIGVALAGLILSSAIPIRNTEAGMDHFNSDMIPFFMAGFRQTLITAIVCCALNMVLVLSRGKRNR